MTFNANSHRTAVALDGAERLGRLLVEAGLVKSERITDALKYQKIRKIKLGQALIELGFASYKKIAYVLSIQLNIPYITIGNIHIDYDLLSLVPREIARDFQLIPLKKIDGALFLVVAEPPVAELVNELSELTKMPVHLAIAPQDEVIEAIEKYYPANTMHSLSIGLSPEVPEAHSANHGKQSLQSAEAEHPKTNDAAKRDTSEQIARTDEWHWTDKVSCVPGVRRDGGGNSGKRQSSLPPDGPGSFADRSGDLSEPTGDDIPGISKITVPVYRAHNTPAFGVDERQRDAVPESSQENETADPPRSLSHMRLYRPDSSVRKDDRLKKRQHSQAVGYFEMGLHALRGGDRGKALKHFEAALAIEPHNRTYRANIQRLKKVNDPQNKRS